jgi:crotonobetainyl-CoA:carnitine CoA-transferase CaiB-like acyl-CoA transferase
MGNVSFVDQIAGFIFAFATLAGLRGRARTGRGCGVSVSLLDVAVFLQSSDVGRASLSAQVRDGSMPEQLFALSDDSVTAFEGPPMRDYADLLGDPEWAIYLETVSANGQRMALPVPPYALSSWRTRSAIGAPALGQDTNALFLSIRNDERQPIRAARGVPE